MIVRTMKEVIDAIGVQWNKKSIKIDWLEIEDKCRSVLLMVERKETSDAQALMAISEIFAAYTKRGAELSETEERRIY